MVFWAATPDETAMDEVVTEISHSETHDIYDSDRFRESLDAKEREVRDAVYGAHNKWYKNIGLLKAHHAGTKAAVGYRPTNRGSLEKNIDVLADERMRAAKVRTSRTEQKFGVIKRRSTDRLGFFAHKVDILGDAQRVTRKEIDKAAQHRENVNSLLDGMKGVRYWAERRELKKNLPNVMKDEELLTKIDSILSKTESKKEDYEKKIEETFKTEHERRDATKRIILESFPDLNDVIDEKLEDLSLGKRDFISEITDRIRDERMSDDKSKLLLILLRQIQRKDKAKKAVAFEQVTRMERKEWTTKDDLAEIFAMFGKSKSGDKIILTDTMTNPVEWKVFDMKRTRQGPLLILKSDTNADARVVINLYSKKVKYYNINEDLNHFPMDAFQTKYSKVAFHNVKI